MPTPPFYVTATPPGQLTTLGTSEKLLVTAVVGDVLTVTRAQGSTTAKSIDVNWIVANAMYVDDVLKSNLVVDQALTGTVNGTNTVFTTSSAFTSIQVYKNGVAMHLTDDFTVTGTNQVTFVTAPATGTKLTATYIVGSQAMINGSNSLISDETPTGTVNGTNTVFTTARAYIPGSLEVFINGVKQKRVTHFTETTPTSGTFTMSDAPLTGDDIMVAYQFVEAVSGNADTVDGYHASTTPTANTLYPLNSSGKFPLAVLGLSAQSNYIFTDQSTTSTVYTNLATVGPSVTVDIGPSGMALVLITCGIYAATVSPKMVSYTVSGATTIAASDDNAARNDNSTAGKFSSTYLQTGLNSGSNTFTLSYKTGSGTGSFFARHITVIPL